MMRDSSPQDIEGLLANKESSSWSDVGDPTSPTTTAAHFTRRTTVSPKRWQKHFSVIIAVLAVTNIITLCAVFILLPAFRHQQQTRTQPRCVNHPPKGIAPTLAHLAETSPQLVNVTFYPDGTPWREHNSAEADEAWLDYEQASKPFFLSFFLFLIHFTSSQSNYLDIQLLYPSRCRNPRFMHY
jgi:hypothetical protein